MSCEILQNEKIVQHRELGLLYKLIYKQNGEIFICSLDSGARGQIIHWTEEEINKIFREVERGREQFNEHIVKETGEMIWVTF